MIDAVILASGPDFMKLKIIAATPAIFHFSYSSARQPIVY